jgi:hypothetical protein
MKCHSNGSHAATADHGAAGIMGAKAITVVVPERMRLCALCSWNSLPYSNGSLVDHPLLSDRWAQAPLSLLA